METQSDDRVLEPQDNIAARENKGLNDGVLFSSQPFWWRGQPGTRLCDIIRSKVFPFPQSRSPPEMRRRPQWHRSDSLVISLLYSALQARVRERTGSHGPLESAYDVGRNCQK
jgi:hypothetical protein